MKTSLLLCLFTMMIVAPALAQVVPVPTSLDPGDEYRLVFVTSSRTQATSTVIADYNTFVTGVANTQPELAALGANWFVIGTTGNVHARDNTGTLPTGAGGTLGVPIFRVDDTKFVDSNDDLWDGDVDVPLSVRQDGTSAGAEAVWTGTSTDGTNDGGFLLGAGATSVGDPPASNVDWIDSMAAAPSTQNRRLYAMSGILTAPEPVPVEPATWGQIKADRR